MGGLCVTVIKVGQVQTNCYLLSDEETREAIIVDPGADAALIKEKCAETRVKPVAVLLTHGHFDHIMAVNEIKEAFGIPVYAAADEKELLADAMQNCSVMVGAAYTTKADIWLNDGDEFELAGQKLKAVSTPGHTAGSMCYHIVEHGVLISGDTLFKHGIGRTDLPTGDYSVLIASIKNKLFTLPADTIVRPGHDAETTIGYETAHSLY